MSAKIVLYMANGACSFIPHALLNHLDIPYKSVVLQGREKDRAMAAADESFSNEEYKKLIPTGYVPALTVDGQLITELPAILTSIAELALEKKLLGSTPMEKAKVYEWLVWISGTLHAQGYGALWHPKRFTDDKAENVRRAVKDKGRKRILEACSLIGNKIDELHAVSNTFIVADRDLYLFWRWRASRLGIDQEDLAETHTKLTALVNEVEKMESVQKALKEEDVSPAF